MLTPHRSLCPTGFLIFMAVLGGISFVTGMVFLLAGAWPVFGFLGLDVLLVYWAFRLNYRSAQAYEQVTVTPSELTRAQGQPSRPRAGMDAQSGLGAAAPRRARGVRAAAAVPGIARARQLGRGSFLPPQEKESFALALSGALAEAKRGPTRTVLE